MSDSEEVLKLQKEIIVLKDSLDASNAVKEQRYNEIKRLKRKAETVKAELDEQTELLDLIRSIKDATPKVPKWRAPRKPSKGIKRATPTLMLSDLHLDETVDPAEVEWYNKYDREIAESRLEHTVKTAIRLTQQYTSGLEFDGFVMPLGGDILSGDIHQELAKTNATTVFDAVVHWVPKLAAAIELVADEFGHVYVPCVVGNHDRNPANRRSPSKNRAKDSLSWVIYHWLSDRFRDDPRIQFEIAEGADLIYSVYDTNYLLTHGDQFKGGGGIAGVFSPIMKGVAKKQERQAVIGKPFDYMIMGHWHQYVATSQFIINGSMKGYDEYAYVSNFKPEQPQQAFWITTPEHGITMSMPVFCNGGESWQN